DDFYGQKYGVIENTNDLKELAVPAYTVHPAGKPTQPADRAMISPQSKAVSVQEYNMLQKDSEYGNELVKAFSPNQQVYGINIWELYDQVRRGMGVYFAESTPVEALRELRKNFREALGRELVQRSDMTESIRDAVERISNAVFPLLVNEHNLSLRVGHLIKVTYLKPMPSGKPMQETVEGELSGFRFYKAMDDLDLNFRGQAKTLRLSIIEDTIKKHSPYIEDVVDYTSPAADDGRSQEPADQAMKVENKGISEAQLGKFWDDLQNEYVFYHATSANNLESIRKYGLDPSRKPYDVADIDKFNAYYQQVMGQEVPFPDRHKEETVYLTANVENAQVYAEAGPEVIQMMLSRIPVLLSSDLLDSAQKDELRAIQAKYGPYMDNHKSVILRIKGRAYFTDKKKFEEEFRHIEAHWGQEAPLTLAEYKKLLLLGLNNEKVGYVKPEDIEFPDQAMNASESKTGGIDLTEAHMNLQTQSAGAAIKFHIDPVLLEQLRNAPGFVPVLISISPMTDLKKFLGINVAV
ncbi:MAG: hypothetical protein KGJ11_06730, partial [Candidatus Omnitrophica bacterium]|nr:hypothetical protein [Candidatus Omnitrophota bacterium]